MNRKLLLFLMLFSLVFASPILAQDTALDATYTSDNGELTVNHPENWEINDEGFNIYMTPVNEDVTFAFLLLNNVVQESLGINHDMSAEVGMQAVVDGMSETGVSHETIVLSEYGDNSVATIEFTRDEEYMIASVVETADGLVMIQVFGTEDEVNASRNIYFDVIGRVSLSLSEALTEISGATDESSGESDDAGNTETSGIELSESFTDKESGLTFSYPDGWDADTGFGGTYLEPDGDDFENIENVIFQFLIVDEDAEEQIGINVNMGAEEAMQTIVDSDDENDLTYDDIVLAEYGENITATVELEIDGEYYVASIVETSGGIVMIQVFGDEDEVNLARDIYFDIVASTILSGDSSSDSDDALLSETYESENDELSFDYPDGWDIDDDDTEISVTNDDLEAEIEFNFWTEEVEESFGIGSDVRAGDAATIIAGFVEDGGLEVELDKGTIGDYLVATVTFASANTSFTSAFVQTNSGVIMVRIEVAEDEFDAVSEIFEAMIESMDYHP